MSKPARFEPGDKLISCGVTCKVIEPLPDGWVRCVELDGPQAGDVFDAQPKELVNRWKRVG